MRPLPPISLIAFSPPNSRACLGSLSPGLVVWGVETGHRRRRLRLCTRPVRAESPGERGVD
jgi:hypothetical protein